MSLKSRNKQAIKRALIGELKPLARQHSKVLTKSLVTNDLGHSTTNPISESIQLTNSIMKR